MKTVLFACVLLCAAVAEARPTPVRTLIAARPVRAIVAAAVRPIVKLHQARVSVRAERRAERCVH